MENVEIFPSLNRVVIVSENNCEIYHKIKQIRRNWIQISDFRRQNKLMKQ